MELQSKEYEILILEGGAPQRYLQKIPGYSSAKKASELQYKLRNEEYTFSEFKRYKQKDRITATKKKIILQFKDHVLVNGEIKSNKH